MCFLIPLEFNQETLPQDTAWSLVRVRCTNPSGKFLSTVVREPNLLVLGGGAWKEPGSPGECHRKELWHSLCVYCRDIAKDVVDDIPQSFLYAELLKTFFSFPGAVINHISPDQLGTLHSVGPVSCGLSPSVPWAYRSAHGNHLGSFQNANAQAHTRPRASESQKGLHFPGWGQSCPARVENHCYGALWYVIVRTFFFSVQCS